jgi:hypothetical protein
MNSGIALVTSCNTEGSNPNAGVVANVSVEYSVGGSKNDEIDLLITPITCGTGGCSDFSINLGGRFAFLKAGNVTDSTTSLGFAAAGMPPFTIHSTAAGEVSPGNGNHPRSLRVNLGSGPIGFSTTASPAVDAISTKLAAARAAEEQLLVKTFGADRAGDGMAVKAAAMWNLISTPAENGGAPLLPVSRVWSFTSGAINSDFSYAIFDWDNLFATLLAASGAQVNTTGVGASSDDAFDGFSIAVSNLFQVLKSKTASGFVPNFAAGGMRSQDRTEPPIGAKVTSDLVKKFGAARMEWVVEVVFNDLLDWNDWFLRKRLKPPLNMVALGTFNDQNGQAGNMQDARYESGLDNSPMYDGTFYNNTGGCDLEEDGLGARFPTESSTRGCHRFPRLLA